MNAEDRLRGIVRAYDAALHDPETKIPTALHMLIEAAREHCGQGTQAAYKRDACNWRPDQDLDICGRPLKAGT